jgi:predicted metal-dependent hydrolase
MNLPFDYTLVRRPYRRSVTVSIYPDNRVAVRAPASVPLGRIEDFLRRKTGWILDQLKRNESRPQKPQRSYQDGEVFSFLGRPYKLRVTRGEKASFETEDLVWKLVLPPKLTDSEEREYAAWRISDWCRSMAQKVLPERVRFYQPCFSASPLRIRVGEFTSQWGSCSSRGKLSFNWKIILAPLEIVDYVVVHELAHLVHLNHSPHFWALVSSVLADYRECREWLQENGLSLEI